METVDIGTGRIEMLAILILALIVFSPPGCRKGDRQAGMENGQPAGKEQTMKMDEMKGEALPDSKLREKLTPLQFQVVRENGTEPAFNNPYWDNKKPGIYVDIVSGEALFSSRDKFSSGTGWPSFMRPLEKDNIVERVDRGHGMVRIEVRSRRGDSHLGHLFDDGPRPTGLRYCINSAALRFIPTDRLEEEGYGRYRKLFE